VNLQVNERAALNLIETGIATSQIELARTLGVRPASVNHMLKRLEKTGWVYRDRIQRYGRGRPMVHFRTKRTGSILVIMWTDTHWTSGVFVGDTPRGSIQRIVSKPSTNLNEVLDHLREVRDLTLAPASLSVSDLAGAVLNIDAVLTEHGRVLKSSVNPWLQQASVKDFSDALGCKVRFDLRIPSIIPELRARVSEGVRTLAVLTVDSGVSAHGASLDPQWGAEVLYRGELGHVVVDPRGAVCGCGHRGCLETIISGPAVVRRVESDVRAGTQTALAAAIGKSPEELFSELERFAKLGSDAYANTLVEEILDRVAWCVSLVENLIGPDVIVLSGYGLAGRESWRERILQKARPLTLGAESEGIRLEFPRLKSEDYLRELARTTDTFRSPTT
jgi:predicted NBD/HSP70 family sugar kinase